MADSQNPNAYGLNRPPGTNIGNPMMPGYVPGGISNLQGNTLPPGPSNMQMKNPVNNGPVPAVSSSNQPLFMPQSSGSNVNGFNSYPTSQGQMQNMGQFSGPRPPVPGQYSANGPNSGYQNQAPHFNQPMRPGMPPGPPRMGQPRPGGPSGQYPGPPQSSQNSNFGPPRSGISAAPPVSSRGMPPPSIAVSQSMTRPPASSTSTPASAQAPPSERSSLNNSPALPTQNFDALEGQFSNTPDQERAPGLPATSHATGPQTPWNPQGSQAQPGHIQPPRPQEVGAPGTFSQQRFGPPSSTGQTFQPGLQPGFPGMTNQRPGFPPVSSQAGFPPMSAPNQRPGMAPNQQPPPTSTGWMQNQLNSSVTSTNQQSGFVPPPSSTNQQSRLPPPPSSTQQVQGFPPPPSSSSQVQGFPPHASGGQVPGFPPPPSKFAPTTSLPNQTPAFPPPSSTAGQVPGFPPPPTSAGQQQYPGFPPTTGQPGPQPGFPTTGNVGQGQPGQPSRPPTGQTAPGSGGKSIEEFVNSYPKPNAGVNSMTSNFNNMSLQGGKSLNLLQQKSLIAPDGIETPKPSIPNDYKNVNCNPEVFRSTLNAIPQTSGLLNKARLPLGVLIHPFKDLSQLPVIQSSVIVRCRSCRTYINPFVYFVDSRRWKCNLCYRVNELPDEFSFDPVSKTYGDPQRRPEIRSATIEFIAPSEYMLRPPQPAVYLYLLDVSFNAVETGYLETFCETLLDVLDRIPGDSRTQIGFVAYDSSVHFFNLEEGLSQPQMLTVSDVDDIFLPCPDNLLVNLNESKSLVTDLLNLLPNLFKGNMETGSALGAALQASYKMMSGTGGRVTVMQTILPTVGPGALQNREDCTNKAAKEVPNLGPAIDFYKKLALDCSAQQIAVDMFLFNGQYADIASMECISRFSGGCMYYYPSFHSVRAPHLCEKFDADLRRYLTRKIGFEAVMRIRCSKGLSIHTFHGNFFVRSTDLLSLPNVNPDAGFGMQISIEESLTDMSTMCFQAALLYTSSKGERRIRVHTLCLPVTNQLSDIHAGADQQAIIALLAKMAVDRSISASMSDAREAIVNAAIDTLSAYGGSLASSQRLGTLCINEQLRLIPLLCLALLKSTAFRTGVATRLDDRSFSLHQFKTLPTGQLIQLLYPHLYPIHTIMEVDMVKRNNMEVPNLPMLQLTSANIDRYGAYLLDIGEVMYLYVGSAISDTFCSDILDKPNFAAVQEGGITELPENDNEGSERLRGFIAHLIDNRPSGAALTIVREDGRYRIPFFQHFVEDRSESSMSYHEFLQHIQKQVKS